MVQPKGSEVTETVNVVLTIGSVQGGWGQCIVGNWTFSYVNQRPGTRPGGQRYLDW